MRPLIFFNCNHEGSASIGERVSRGRSIAFRPRLPIVDWRYAKRSNAGARVARRILDIRAQGGGNAGGYGPLLVRSNQGCWACADIPFLSDTMSGGVYGGGMWYAVHHLSRNRGKKKSDSDEQENFIKRLLLRPQTRLVLSFSTSDTRVYALVMAVRTRRRLKYRPTLEYGRTPLKRRTAIRPSRSTTTSTSRPFKLERRVRWFSSIILSVEMRLSFSSIYNCLFTPSPLELWFN